MTVEAVLRPRSVALVGASDDPTKTASRPLRYLRQGGFAGPIYQVARRAIVQGEPAWPSLAALPDRPDHAFILLPTDAAVEAVADCVRLGIPAATVLASGFSESGAEGAEKEARLRALVRGSATRLLGPSSLGLVNLLHGTVLTANAAFAEPDLPRGGLFVASQSGSMIGALASRGKARGIGFAGLVSVGGEVDLDVGTISAATLDDPGVTAYLLFLETIRDGAALRAFAEGAAARGKPVVAFKLGRSAAAAELAQSHTGALAGEDDIAAAFLADCGIARVDTLEALLEAPALLRRLPARPRGARTPTVGVVTTTGGGAAMVVDQLGLRGIDVPKPGEATLARLAEAGIATGGGRILDLTMAGTRYEVMKVALDTLLAAPEFDAVLAVVGSSARFQPDLAVRPIIDCAGTAPHLAAFLAPEAPDALRNLAAAGVPAFRTPEAAADAIAAALRRSAPANRPAAVSMAAEGPVRLLDELAAYRLLAGLGLPHAACVELGDSDPGLRFPVAVKLLSDRVAHKSDIGGVVLGVTGMAEVAAAAERIRASVRAHLAEEPVRLLMQEMAQGVGEALIGYRVDPALGPLVLLAAGGVATELYRDRSVRMAPVDLATAHAMIDEVKGFALIKGFRGRPRGDVGGLARAIVALSELAIRPDLAVRECEINPLIVRRAGDGVVAVDAVAWISR